MLDFTFPRFLHSLSFHFTFPLFSLYNPSLYFTLSGIRTQDLKLQVECYTNVRYSACAVSAHRYSACALASSRARADDLTRDRAEARITRAHSCRYCKRECHKERVVSSITYLYSLHCSTTFRALLRAHRHLLKLAPCEDKAVEFGVRICHRTLTALSMSFDISSSLSYRLVLVGRQFLETSMGP